MQNIVLFLDLFVAIALIIVILMQRSEGGALGIGGSGGGIMSARGAANFLTRLTTILAASFLGLTLLLAVLSKNPVQQDSVTDLLEDVAEPADVPTIPDNN